MAERVLSDIIWEVGSSYIVGFVISSLRAPIRERGIPKDFHLICVSVPRGTDRVVWYVLFEASIVCSSKHKHCFGAHIRGGWQYRPLAVKARGAQARG